MHEEYHRAEMCRIFLIVIMMCSYADVEPLKVTVPESPIVAARGQAVVLGCDFTPDFVQNPDLSSLLVTWQREEDNRVVHSYYYQKDQLDRQNQQYQKRTALFVSELRKGNASVRIENMGVKDAGRYICIVSTFQGTDKGALQLDYAAYYTEPRLSIDVVSSNILVRYETEGFPAPNLTWKGENGEILKNQTTTTMELNQETGLYYIECNHTAPNTRLNFTFILENQLLNQYLQRPVSYSAVQNSCMTEAIALAVISLLLALTTLMQVWIYYRNKK